MGEESAGEQRPGEDACPSNHVADVFSEIVFSAEKACKPVKLLALTGTDPTRVLPEAATCLKASGLWISSGDSADSKQLRTRLQEVWRVIEAEKAELEVLIVCEVEAKPEALCLHR